MNVLSIFLLVLFIIVSILLVLLVLVQNEDGDSLGGVFAGGSSSAFGSRSGNVLTKVSSVLGALFFILSFSLAMLNRSPNDDKGVEAAGRQSSSVQTEAGSDWSPFELPKTDDISPVIESPNETSETTAPSASQNTQPVASE